MHEYVYGCGLEMHQYMRRRLLSINRINVLHKCLSVQAMLVVSEMV